MKKLYEIIELFEKQQKEDHQGGRTTYWKSLGTCFAALEPVSIVYPLRKDHKEYYEGSAFSVFTPYDPRLFKAQRLLWEKNAYFIIQTPGLVAASKNHRSPYLNFKVALDPSQP